MGQQCIITITTEGNDMKVDVIGDMAPLAVMRGLTEAYNQMITKAVIMLTDKVPGYRDGKYHGDRSGDKS